MDAMLAIWFILSAALLIFFGVMTLKVYNEFRKTGDSITYRIYGDFLYGNAMKERGEDVYVPRHAKKESK